MEIARRLDSAASGARFLTRRKWRRTRHLRFVKRSSPDKDGGSSSSSDSNLESGASGARDASFGVTRQTHSSKENLAKNSTSPCAAWPNETPLSWVKPS